MLNRGGVQYAVHEVVGVYLVERMPSMMARHQGGRLMWPDEQW